MAVTAAFAMSLSSEDPNLIQLIIDNQ